MTETREKAIYSAAIETWGKEAQVVMVMEEMSELQKELCKNLRGRENIEAIAEEIADVKIMLGQMERLFSIGQLVDDYKAKKLGRLALRLTQANGGTFRTEEAEK